MNKYDEILDKVYDYLIETGIASESEISLVTAIKGWNLESLNDILYVRTGYRSLEQIEDKE